MKRYIKDGQIKFRNQIVIRQGGRQYINPQEDMIIADGWEEYIEPTPTEEEQRAAEKSAEIRRNKRILEATDYKVIKCLEAVLCGEEMPYDIKALHEEREGYRRIINENE